MSKEEKNLQIALFRYSLIGSAIAGTYEAPSLARHLRNVASKKHLHPNGKYVDVTFHSLERWYYKYRKYGLPGITPVARSDTGKPRALTKTAISKIYEIKEKFPHITGKAVHKKLIESGVINAVDTSLTTVQRFIKNNDLKPPSADNLTVKAFEMEFANDCWQADTSYSAIIKSGGAKKQTYLIAFIDDASRVITHKQHYFNDNAINMQDSFKQAIAKFGIPKMIFVDLGGPYDNLQLRLICASLGIVLAHGRPRAAKGRSYVKSSVT